MGNLASFAKPQKLIDRAQNAWSEAHFAMKSFVTTNNITTIVQKDLNTGESIKKVVFVNPFPDLIEARITDAINNARNAFDQILFAACDAIGRPIKDGHYPWATDKTDLGWKFEDKKTGKERIPRELWDVLSTQEPYPRNDADGRGDSIIRAMATLANRKHTIGIEVGCSVSSFSNSFTALPGSREIIIPNSRWDPVKNEMELLRWTGTQPRFNQDHQVSFHVVFDATAPGELSSVSAFDAVTQFIQNAQRALDALKSRARELGAI